MAPPKTKRVRRPRRRWRRNLGFPFWAAVGGLGFLVLMVLLARIGGGLPSAEDLLSEDRFTAEQIEALRESVARHEASFRAIRESRPVQPPDLVLLEVALSGQRELVADRRGNVASRADLQKLAELEALYDTEAARTLHEESLAREEQARAAARLGEREQALSLYEAAIALQDRVNREFTRGERHDRARLIALQQARNELLAEPVAREVRELEQEGRLATERGRFGQAEQAYAGAVERMRVLLRDYRGTRFARLAELARLEKLHLEARAGTLNEQVASLRATAEAKAADGRFADAAVDLEDAMEAQRGLMRDFPGSRFSGKDVLDGLEVLRQTILSEPLQAELVALEAELGRALRERRLEEGNQLAASFFRQVRQLEEGYRLSEHRDADRLSKARFLDYVRPDFRVVQEAAYGLMEPVPGHGGRSLARVETSQALYRLLMGSNPSGQAEPARPVESVSWFDAQAFCQRLGWVLALPVSLPDERTFTAALGEVRPESLEAQSWHAGNADRQTRAVGSSAPNPHRFSDLLGNVAEWLSDTNPRDEREALVIGGSARDALSRLTTVPRAYVGKNERDRFTGFRWMVEHATAPDETPPE